MYIKLKSIKGERNFITSDLREATAVFVSDDI